LYPCPAGPESARLSSLLGFSAARYGGLLLLQGGWSSPWLEHLTVSSFTFGKEYTFLPRASSSIRPIHARLSYIFFRVMHLLIETGEGGEKRASDSALTCSTASIHHAGFRPIQRYDEFARDQFAGEPLRWAARDRLQLERIVRGFSSQCAGMLFDMVESMLWLRCPTNCLCRSNYLPHSG